MSFLDLIDWEPRAIACSRGNIRTGMTYDAEVKFLTTQYCIGKGFRTREDAMAEANKVVELLKVKIRKAGIEELDALYPQAKE